MRLSHATWCLGSSLLLSPTDLPQQQHHHQGALVQPSILTPIRRGGPSCTTVPFFTVVCFFVFPLPLRRSQALPETLGDRLGCFWGTLKLVRLRLGSRGTKTDQKETKRQAEPSRGKRASARLLPSQGPLRRFPSVGSPAAQQRDHRDSGCCGLSFPSHHQTSKRQTDNHITHLADSLCCNPRLNDYTCRPQLPQASSCLCNIAHPPPHRRLPHLPNSHIRITLVTSGPSPHTTAQPSPQPPAPPSPSSSGATSTTSLPKPVHHPPPPNSPPNHDLPGPRYHPKSSTPGYQSRKKENTPACAFHGGAAISFLPRPSCSHGLTRTVSRCLTALSPITIGLNRDSE